MSKPNATQLVPRRRHEHKWGAWIQVYDAAHRPLYRRRDCPCGAFQARSETPK
jgi:hypothetical protein